MERRAVRILLLLWLGWYLSGPVAEMVDVWDTPPQEMHDIARGAGGMVALIGTTLAIALSQIREVRKRLRQKVNARLRPIAVVVEKVLPATASSPILLTHSPPIQIRI